MSDKKVCLWLTPDEAEKIESLLGDHPDLKAKIEGQRKGSEDFVTKAHEYQQVAAIVCHDLDILKDIADLKNSSAEELAAQINLTHSMKEEVIHKPKNREMRFSAMQFLASIPRAT